MVGRQLTGPLTGPLIGSMAIWCPWKAPLEGLSTQGAFTGGRSGLISPLFFHSLGFVCSLLMVEEDLSGLGRCREQQ